MSNVEPFTVTQPTVNQFRLRMPFAVIEVLDGGEWLPVPSPCCQAEIAEPMIVTAVCLGCAQAFELKLIDWNTVRGDRDAPSRLCSGLARV